MKGLYLGVVLPDKEIFNGEVDSVTLSDTFGSFTILPRHVPIISSLKAGVLSYVTKDGEEHVQGTRGSFVEMNDNEASVRVD